MSSSWERVPVTRMCATCAREFEHTPAPGRQPTRCPKCRGEKPAPKSRAIALVPAPAVALAIADTSPPPPAQKIEVGAVIQQLERHAILIADAVRALRALEER